MTSDPLRRLTAGLAEDERIARGTFEPDMEGQDHWQLDGANVWTEEPQPTLVVKHAWPNEARHIARQDPKLTLDRVEAIRKVIRAYVAAVGAKEQGSISRRNVTQDETAVEMLGFVIETLASIYPEDANEAGGTSDYENHVGDHGLG